MENYCFNQFNEKFSEFMSNLNITFEGDEELDIFNKKLQKVNLKKLIKRYVKIMKPYKNKLNVRDESIFDEEDILILPKVNMSRLWKQNLSETTKTNIWQYLQMLYVLGEIVMTGKTKNLDMLDKMLKEVDTNNNNNNNKSNTGLKLESLLQNFGTNQIDEQLSNINKDDISEASDNIKKLLSNSESKSSNLMCDMVNDISAELANTDKKEGGIMGIFKIAENVANKFKPKIESGEFDLNELLGSAQQTMSQIYGNMPTDENMPDQMPNPMNLLSQLLNNFGKNDDNTQMNENMPDPMNLLSQLLNNFGKNDDTNTSQFEQTGDNNIQQEMKKIMECPQISQFLQQTTDNENEIDMQQEINKLMNCSELKQIQSDDNNQ